MLIKTMLMRNYAGKIPVIFLLFLSFNLRAQMLDSAALALEPEYTNLEEALKNPGKVYKLNLRRKKLKEFPKEIFTFTNLQQLNLSKNKISVLPGDISKLTKLEVLNVSANKLDTLCPEIGQLVNIRKLILSENEIAILPSTIGNLTKMYYLDLWGNEFQHLPEEITKLQNTLRVVDMRVISLKEELQEEMLLQLPNTKFFFSAYCNCD